MGVKRKIKAKIIDDYDLQELFDEFIDGKIAVSLAFPINISNYTFCYTYIA